LTKALQTITGEFKTLCLDIASAAIFKLDGETLAANESATPEQTQTLIASLNRLTHTGCIGGLQKLVVQDVNSQVSVVAVGDVYLATSSSRLGDQKVITSLTEIVAPTIIRLALKIPNTEEMPAKINRDLIMQRIEVSLPKREQTDVTADQQKIEAEGETSAPHVLSTQFLVEKIGGLLFAADTVRIDSRVLSDWQDSCEKQFSSVLIETLDGKTVTCKCKPKKEGKGTIGIPERILQALNCERGKLVMVKPVID
jgi:hypothetical protein